MVKEASQASERERYAFSCVRSAGMRVIERVVGLEGDVGGCCEAMVVYEDEGRYNSVVGGARYLVDVDVFKGARRERIIQIMLT
jgi:hypothetical protein